MTQNRFSDALLVPIDASEPSQWAVDEAVELAEELGTKVSLAHVVDVVPLLAPEFAADEAVHRAALVQEGWDMLRTAGRRVPLELFGEGYLREGDTARQIVALADEIRPRLIVVGTHARGGLGRFLLGSVAEQVVRRASCPVLTVAHPRAAAAGPAESCESASAPAAEICYGHKATRST